MISAEPLGWLSSVILIATVGRQIYKQVRDGTSRGVSKWLYIGQFSAEIGFIAYSLLLKNWVFVVTNTALLLENIVGLGVVLYHRRRAHAGPRTSLG